MKRGPGRPKAQIDPSKLCTVDEAIRRLHNYLMEQYKDEHVVERMCYRKGSIYNLLSQKRLERYGTRRCALINFDELLQLCS